jgi:hypothetical protein
MRPGGRSDEAGDQQTIRRIETSFSRRYVVIKAVQFVTLLLFSLVT